LENSLSPQSSLSIDLTFQCDLNTLRGRTTFFTFTKTEKADVSILVYIPAATEKNYAKYK